MFNCYSLQECTFYFSQYFFIAEKIHCVWMTNGVISVLFDCQGFTGLEKLQSAPLDCIINKRLVREYLDKVGCIPSIKQTMTLLETKTIDL